MDIKALEQKAIDYARRGDFGADARQVNEDLTKAAPSNEGAWTRLARCNIELGLFDDASAALESALQLNPQNTIARSLLQETIRRQLRVSEPEDAPRRTTTRARKSGTGSVKSAKAPKATARGGFGRPQFAALEQLPPVSALEALGPALESLLMALNDRPFAAKVVEARNRAGKSGSKLFRRNSMYAGGNGHVYAFHHGGRWEPQFNIGFFAGEHWQRAGIRAGIGFNLSVDGSDPDREAGQERIAEHFERFQQLVSAAWKGLLTEWMSSKGGFIQYADRPAAVDLQPKDAVEWLINNQNATEQGWVFVGAWLFADRPDDAEIMADPARLTKWAESSFVDLLPLWTSVYRD